ncbi:MAG: hypothetical protein OEY11_04290 [Gammaproteobacteria bacterium]|nr:hypothetical protein [Gammaproteobacteria bacterium]
MHELKMTANIKHNVFLISIYTLLLVGCVVIPEPESSEEQGQTETSNVEISSIETSNIELEARLTKSNLHISFRIDLYKHSETLLSSGNVIHNVDELILAHGDELVVVIDSVEYSPDLIEHEIENCAPGYPCLEDALCWLFDCDPEYDYYYSITFPEHTIIGDTAEVKIKRPNHVDSEGNILQVPQHITITSPIGNEVYSRTTDTIQIQWEPVTENSSVALQFSWTNINGNDCASFNVYDIPDQGLYQILYEDFGSVNTYYPNDLCDFTIYIDKRIDGLIDPGLHGGSVWSVYNWSHNGNYYLYTTP